MMDSIHDVNEGQFDMQVLRSSKPVAITFYATACEDSQALSPTMSALADEYKDWIRFLKVNIDQVPALKDRYDIRTTPAVMVFMDGEIYDRLEAEMNAEVYRDVFESVLTQQR